MFNNQEKETILKKLAERYGKEYQNSWQQDLIDNVLVFNPKEALRLIYRDFAFVRAGGERAGYGRIAQQALEEFEGESIPDPNQLWERFKAICIKEKLGVNQRLNSGVVKGLAKLASKHGNLFNWIKKEVETNGRLAPLALTLMNINGIGFKIATFILRDAVWVIGKATNKELEKRIKKEERVFLQPVDRWVQRIAGILWPEYSEVKDMTAIAVMLAGECINADVSGIEFNQGVWYFGSQVVREEENLENELNVLLEKERCEELG